ncbi:hypothetical protein WN943_018843 [Citrus x changshan-huyou]
MAGEEVDMRVEKEKRGAKDLGIFEEDDDLSLM